MLSLDLVNKLKLSSVSGKPVILCVDDELIILSSLGQQLKKKYGKNFLIEAVDSAESALEIVKNCNAENIDIPVVICDRLMPTMSGDDLLIQIHKTNPETRKILLTGQASTTSITNAVNNANLYRYITKPWSNEELLSSVEEALGSFYNDKFLEEKTLELEKNLLFEEIKYKNLIEHMSGAIYIMTTDNNREFLFHSPQIAKITHFSQEEFNYELWISRIHPEDKDITINKFNFPPSGKKSFLIEYRFFRKDGELIWLEEDITIIYKDKLPFLFQGIRNDITNRKIAADKLRLYAEEIEKVNQKLLTAFGQAEQANKSKSQFLANITHEFNTPLNSILGYCQLLEMEQIGKLNEKQSKFISYIYESGNHLLALVNTILDFSKIEVGRVVIEKEDFDLGQLMEEVVNAQEAIANEKGITIDLEINKANKFSIFADRTRIKQVLINLISNALKFTPAGEKVGFKIFKQADNTILTCWDTGIGIPDSELGRVFEPFEQIRNNFTIKTKGTGLGLSIVKSILDLHGFSINLTSEVGKGSTFTITIPPKQMPSIFSKT